MYVELYHSLRSLLPEIGALIQKDSAEEVLQKVCDFRGFEVDRCPFPEDGMLATNLVFVLCKEVLAGTPFAQQPAQLAELLKQTSEKRSEQLFRFVVGGKGYLNATPTDECHALFREKVLVAGAKSLFSFEPLAKQSQRVEMKSFSSSMLELKCSDALFSKALNRIKIESEEPRIFTAALDRIGKVKSFADYLMLLALIVDDEIECAPYLNQVPGRQNVPWYLERFFFDIDRAALDADVENYSNDLFQTLYNFRRGFAVAQRIRRPEILLETTLQLVRSFYSLFHRPEFRTLRSNETVRGKAPPLFQVVKDAVANGLHLLSAETEIDRSGDLPIFR